MKQLSKTDQKLKAEHVEKLTLARERLDAVLAEYNAKVAELWTSVQDAVNAHNEAVQDADRFRDDVVSQIDDYMNDRSDAWREGDRGQAYEEWKSGWEYLSLTEAQLDQPDPLEIDDLEGGDAFNGTEDEPAL